VTFPTPTQMVASCRHRSGSGRVAGGRRPSLWVIGLVIALAVLGAIAAPSQAAAVRRRAESVNAAHLAPEHHGAIQLAVATHPFAPTRAGLLGSLRQPIELTGTSLPSADILRIQLAGRWFLASLFLLVALLTGTPHGTTRRWSAASGWSPPSSRAAGANPRRGPPVS